MNPLQQVLDFLERLEEHNIFYRLSCARSDALMVELAIPGERWEVEFFPDGHVEVEIFSNRQGIYGEEVLPRLFEEENNEE